MLIKSFRVLINLIGFYQLKLTKGVSIDRELTVKGIPIIQVNSGAKITIGRNVTINSRNFSYHANMHSPVKLMADKAGAQIFIGNNTRIIGDNCLIAANVQMMDANGHEISFDNLTERINTKSDGYGITIENNVWIGLNVIILPGVTIGAGSVVAANSVVSKDVPPMVVYGGNPGKILKRA